MRLLISALLVTVSTPALAQQAVPADAPPQPLEANPATTPTEPGPPAETAAAAPAAGEDEFAEDIVVTGGREPGQVVGDIKPEVQLRPADIRAYGASNLAELLEAIAPITGSNQGSGGQPVTLLDGRRISGFREIRDLPPEAVVRVDILPEEVALKYGYRPDQKVVNFVLRPRFRAVTAEADIRGATDGGRGVYEGDVNFLRLNQGTRLSLDGEYTRSNPLFETDRDLVNADPNRTLLSASDAFRLNGTYARAITAAISGTINGEFSGAETRAALGSSAVTGERLVRDTRTRTGAFGYAANGNLGAWNWSLDGGFTRDWSTTLTDRAGGRTAGRDYARSVAETLQSTATANGRLFELPAGPVSATLKAGVDFNDIESESRRAAGNTFTNLSRDRINGQANVDLPIFDDGPIGDLSLNANGLLEQLSDFGTLRTIGAGFNWTPVRAVRVIGSVTQQDGAPTIQDLGNPVLTTPNVRVIDLTTGRTVDVTRITGGNPNLIANDRRVIKLGLNVRPIDGTDLTLLANYTDTRIDNPTGSFPVATPEIEAAFPDRFSRDAAGNLTRIDSRPVNFARSEQRALRWGFNWSETLEAPPPTGPDGQPLTEAEIQARRDAFRAQFRDRPPGDGPPPGAGGRGPGGGGGRGFGGRGGGFGGGGGRAGRIQLSIFHNWRFADTVLIRPGVPELDLLSGSAIGSGGGVSRHEIDATAGYNRNGLGVRAEVNWQSATTVRQNPAGPVSAQDLRFGDLTTVNLRTFLDLGAQRDLVRKSPFFRGARLTIGVDNVFNQRLDVRDASGAVPIGYQPDLIDPLGRSVRISFRKIFLPSFGGQRGALPRN